MHVNILLAYCRTSTLFQAHLNPCRDCKFASCTAFLFCFLSLPGTGCCQVYGSTVCQLHLLLVMGTAAGFGRRFLGGTLGRGESRQGLTASVCFHGSYGVTPKVHSKPQTQAVTFAMTSAILFKKKEKKTKTEKGQRKNL